MLNSRKTMLKRKFKYFTGAELIRTSTGISNNPDPTSKNNIERLIIEVLDPIRERLGSPITVTSGYRSPAVNRAVGGSLSSQHLTGSAADLKCKNNKKLFEVIKNLVEEGKIEIGQCINEYGYSWIHVSLPDNRHQNQFLEAKKIKGKTTYIRIC